MVHQSPESSAEYVELMSRWGEHFTCIAPDTPGFGYSDPLSGSPEIGDFADALSEFVGAMGLQGCLAYGFHSGGIILVTTLKRHPELFSALAIGGYAIWTEEEMRIFGESYLPPFQPSAYGEHLTWLWNRILEQTWFFPWFDVRDEARLPNPKGDPAHVQKTVMTMLDSGDAYRAGYGAVLRAPRDIPPPDEATAPVFISAYRADPLYAHIDRLGELPRSWQARKVETPEDQEAASLAFLQEHASDGTCGALPEDANEGWVEANGALVHWRGEQGADRLVLHAPADEMPAEIDAGTLAIDVPGHGLSEPADDIRAAIEAAAEALGAERILWPSPPEGDPDRLYPDLTPRRFGEHLQTAWQVSRAEGMFRPWYDVQRDRAIAVDPARLEVSELARRSRARIRAGAAARAYHLLLQD